ncbi:MAG: AAA family ATPase [Chloroflexi bacterium]|nr:AAA family ATPase [Chloroflexota bacterium]
MVDVSPQSDDRSFEPLSKRELDVLALVAAGLSNSEIAERLVVAYTTVKWYIRQIFNKLGVDNRAQATERARALGLVSAAEAAQPIKHNLPAPVSPFIGRTRELADLTRLLREGDTRLITILAPGGMGKTRLALALAETFVGTRYIVSLPFPDGVYVVPLAPLTTPDGIIPAIADALGFQFAPDSRTPVQQLLDFLRHKHLLLVLDNFEHLLDGAPLVTDMLQAAPGVAALVTSRERLNLHGESVYTLGGMAYPEQAGDDALSYSAVQLFVQSARRARADFAPEAGPDGVVRVCQLAQGMPLALELAAAWVGGLSPDEIAEEITRSLDFLRTSKRDVPERLRSVRAVFEAAWARLTTDEQAVFRRLSVFRGGCTREAAQAVTGADVMTLAALVDKALLRRDPASGRYEVHELLRQYAAEQLEHSGEAQQVRYAHAGYFAQFAARQAEKLRGAQQLEALNQIETDFDNIQRGFQTAGEARDTDLIEQFAELWLFFDMQARYQEGLQIYEQALHHFGGEENRTVGKLLLGQGLFLHRLLFNHEALPIAENCVRIMEACGQPQDTIIPFMLYAIVLDALEHIERSHAIYQELYPLTQQYGDTWEKSTSLFLVGGDALNHKDLDRGRALLEQAYRDYQKVGNSWGAVYPLRDLAYLAYQGKDYQQAEQLYNELLNLAQKNRFPTMVADGLEGLGLIARARGDLREAKDFLEESLTIYRAIGSSRPSLELNLSRIVCEMNGFQTAKPYFRAAFDSTKALQSVTALLYLVLVIAENLAQTGDNEKAVELIGFYLHHPEHESVLTFQTDRPAKLVVQLRNDLSPDEFAAAWQRGQAASIEMLLEKMLYST